MKTIAASGLALSIEEKNKAAIKGILAILKSVNAFAKLNVALM
jgi:hypothetical protein